MAYANKNDIQSAAGGPERLLELTDVRRTGTIDVGVLAAAQAEAESWMDGYIQRRAATPLSPVPARARTMAARETIYQLMIIQQLVPEWAAKEHEGRHMWLQDFAKGLVSFGTDPVSPKSTAVVPEVLERSPLEAVSRRSLRGFC